MKKLIITILILIGLTVIFIFREAITSTITANWRVFEVGEVLSDPRSFERYESFIIEGRVEEGWGIPTLFKVFALSDEQHNSVLVISKTKTLPKPGNEPRRFKVQIYGQPQVFDTDLLILKEMGR